MKEKIKELVKEIGISEFENILKEFKQEGSFLDNYQSAKEWFNNLLKEVSIKKRKEEPNSLFFRDKIDECIMIQNDDVFLVSNKIWDCFESEFGLEDEEISFIIQSKVEKEFRIEISKPAKQIHFKTHFNL